MPLKNHKLIGLGNIHIAHTWEYPNAAARTGASGFVTEDLKKLALQTDDNTLWLLTATTPTWIGVSSGTGHSHSNQGELDLVTDGDHDVRTDNPHGTDLGNLGAGTLAELNTAVTDATLDDSSAARPPISHTHVEADITDLRVFGTHYQSAEQDAEASTTATAYQERVTFTTPSLPAGDYRVGFAAEVTTSDPAKGVAVQVELDDTTVLNEVMHDHSGIYSDGVWYGVSGFKKVPLTAAAHTFDLDFKSLTAAKTAYIRKARLEFWRVG